MRAFYHTQESTLCGFLISSLADRPEAIKKRFSEITLSQNAEYAFSSESCEKTAARRLFTQLAQSKDVRKSWTWNHVKQKSPNNIVVWLFQGQFNSSISKRWRLSTARSCLITRNTANLVFDHISRSYKSHLSQDDEALLWKLLISWAHRLYISYRRLGNSK